MPYSAIRFERGTGMGKQNVRRIARALLALGFFLTANSAMAEAGRVMFVSGKASLIRGAEIPIAKGTAVETGDKIVTGADGRVQLLMADGDRIALRPSSEFTIDEFSGPLRTAPGTPVAGTRPSSWRSFYSLAKGGFRTLTQSLGERDPSSYQVRTPVATIGIRGTDYTVQYSDAGGNGGLGRLIGGVSKGGIAITGANGETNEVKDNEFFEADNDGFNKLPEAPDGLNDSADSDGDGNYEEQVGEGEGEDDSFSARTDPSEGEGSGTEPASSETNTTDFDSSDPPQQPIESTDGDDLTGGEVPVSFRGAALGVAGSSGEPLAGSELVDAAALTRDGNGNLTSVRTTLDGVPVTFSIGTASNQPPLVSSDDTTQLQWGRWSGGFADLQDENGNSIGSADLTNKSLHWIYGPASAEPPVIPVHGSYSYSLVGSTPPTNNSGDDGTLSLFSTLSADFQNQTVDSHLELSVGPQAYNADGSGGFGPGGSFEGDYDSIDLNSSSCGSCSGEFAGFFTPGSDGSSPPPGAGMTYSLSDGSTGGPGGGPNTVSGAAAFGDPQGPPPPGDF